MIKLFKYNFQILVLFEVIYSAIISFLIIPTLKYLFDFSLQISDVLYLTQESIFPYLTNPFVVLILIFIMFLTTIFTVFEIFALNTIFIYEKKQQKININSLVLNTFQKSKSALKSKNLFFFFYVVLMIPFLGFLYQNPILQEIQVPDFIIESILKNSFLLSVTALIFILILLFVFLNIYTFLFMFNEQKYFYQAFKNSIGLVKKTFWKLNFQLLKLFIFIGLLYLTLYLLQNLLLEVSSSFDSGLGFILGSSFLLSINTILITVFEIIVKVVSVFVVADLFFQNNKVSEFKKADFKRTIANKYVYILIFFSLFVFSLFNIFVLEFSEFESKTKVMAHRGSSFDELENTKEAFLLSMKQGVKYIELDVVLTKDQKVAIIHDFNLKRLAGFNVNVKDLTLKELQNFEIYSKNKEKKGKILSLKELLPMINKNTILNVEIKSQNGNETQIAQKTEEVLKNTPRHMVSSLSQKVLFETKKINSKRKTGLVMAIALGDYEKLSFVDFFSIEENFVNQKVVEKIHKAGKKVFIWTVNNTDSVDEYYDMSVDGIITDLPKIVKDEIEKSRLSFKLRKFRKIFGLE